MALHLHRADRTDPLADGLGALLADPLPDPFAGELVLVSARGMERWLSQRLSHVLGRRSGADGVCAGVSFRSPASLLAEITGTTDDDPWSPEAMTWPLLEAIDASLDEPWCRTPATHLGHIAAGDDEAELRRGRRYAVARRLAGLFVSYAEQRPQMLIDWLDGSPTDGAGGDLDDDLRWQPHLWRALVDRVDADPPHVRHAETIARLREAPSSELPSRLSLFGHTRLPATDIELLNALSTHHDLHLWLPHPSDDLWRALADTTTPCTGAKTPAATMPTTPSWTPSAATCASCNARCPAVTPTNSSAAQRNLIPCWAGCNRTFAPMRSGPDRVYRPLTTARCRYTAATGRPGRSTRCARCCWVCCRMTRCWSRETSWLCARTSKHTHH